MSTSDDGGCKRKSEESKELYFWFNSSYSHKCGALFKLKLRIDGDVIVPKKESLKMLATFFLQYGDKHTEYASCAPYNIFGSSSCKLFLMPNEFDRVFQQQDEFDNPIHQTQPPIPSSLREKPCVYVIENDQMVTLEKPPLAHKVNPIAVTVDGKVYVLSRRNESQWALPEPTFEVYDPEKDSWEAWPQPWFNHHTRPYLPSPESTQYWDSPGFAVFGHFIIVCSVHRCHHTKFLIHSYNTVSKEWKPLQYPSTPLVRYRDNGNIVEDEITSSDDHDDYDDDSDDDDTFHPSQFLVWVGEAVVVKNFIYAYVSTFRTLVSYKCCANNNNNNNTLSFDACIAMERCGFRQVWAQMMPESTFKSMSGAVGKIGDDLICLVRTMLFASLRGSKSQPVHLLIFRLDNEKGGINSILQSFDLVMPGCADFGLADIFSCFVLPPEVASKWDHRDKDRELSYELGADASLVSDVGMKEATGFA